MASQKLLLATAFISATTAFQPLHAGRGLAPAVTSGWSRSTMSTLQAKRKGDLFSELSELEGGNEKADSAPKESKPEVSYEIAANKEKAVLAPEEVFFEGPPSWTEMVIPGISILTVIGIVPFIATATRQAWVKYKITSRRISVTSGFNGQDLTEITYDEIFGMKFVYRGFGATGDVVIELRDGAKLEMRSVPNFDEVYGYIFSRTNSECQKYSDMTKSMKEAAVAGQ